MKIIFFALALFLHVDLGLASTIAHPSDPDFFKLRDGTDLGRLVVFGEPLSPALGDGCLFTYEQVAKYRRFKDESMRFRSYPLQWSLIDIGTRKTVARSAGADRRFFAGSIVKLFGAATFTDDRGGVIDPPNLQKLADLLVVSANSPWIDLQRMVGDGDPNLGREKNFKFTQRMMYLSTRGYQGVWTRAPRSLKGGETSADDVAAFLADTGLEHYPGAEIIWKLLYASRTGNDRAKKYLPRDLFAGGKTGTYDGPTIDPQTGLPTTASLRHHALVFRAAGRDYGLAIFSDLTGQDDDAAVLAAGLYYDLIAE